MNAKDTVETPRGRKRGNLRSVRQFPWTKQEEALLGKFSDREVGELLNRRRTSVTIRRKFLGIAGFGRGPQPWRKDRAPRDPYAHLFAAKSDGEIRAILGWSYKRIQTRRRQLAAYKGRKQPPDWSLEEDRLLGTQPDEVLARKLNRSLLAVQIRRGLKKIRIRHTNISLRKSKPWSAEDDEMLGTRTDSEIARLLGRSKMSVAQRRWKLGVAANVQPRPWTPEEDALLGTRPDVELAKAFGRTAMAVKDRRLKLNHTRPGAMRKPPRPKVSAPRRYWTPTEDALLGVLSDEEVAQRLKVTRTRVNLRRWQLGIPPKNPRLWLWSRKEIALLGTKPDAELARLLHRSASSVTNKRLALGIGFHNPNYKLWQPNEIAQLNTGTAREVARRLGRSMAAVLCARRKLRKKQSLNRE